MVDNLVWESANKVNALGFIGCFDYFEYIRSYSNTVWGLVWYFFNFIVLYLLQ